MKKILFAVAAAAMIFGVSSCKSEKAEKSAENKDAATEAAAPMTPAEINAKAGAEFMAKLHDDPEVKFTESGLGYKVIKDAEGAKPVATSVANVDYEGRLTNGEVFDSSNGNPVKFPLNQVIPGFTEGIMLMSPGATYEFYMPSELAYGQRGAGNVIGPNETLIFKVTLVDFE